MIAFSCVHCGQRMSITEEDGSKKATCRGCRQVVLLPASEPGLRRSRRSIVAGLAGEETRVAVAKAIHEIPTRIEETIDRKPPWTHFLSPAQGEDEIGRLGGYRILEVVGSGGMGVVFRAHDPQLDREVALKVMQPHLAASNTARQRFLREARAAARLQHDHIVTIHQVGEDRGMPFLAMPFLKGQSLDAWLFVSGGSLPVDEAVRIGCEVAAGLQALHDQGMVHRDIKPGNIFLEGDGRRVKILDFGLARTIANEAQLTLDGSIIGTPAFMAPEQTTRGPIDGRADLFSLGCVLYLMLTGRLPFEEADPVATLVAVRTTEPAALGDGVPDGVARFVLRLLAKRPEDRPATAREVIAALA